MNKIYPKKIKRGGNIRIIAPSRSISILSGALREIADRRFTDLGVTLTFGKHVKETDEFVSTSIASRVEDLHEAFSDPTVEAIVTVIGGFNCNQLLRYIDWDLIRKNPKIFCGYSDITALNNAIFAKTGLVTYSGPHYSSFGQKLHFEYTLEYFKKCLMEDNPFDMLPSGRWSDDMWYIDQDKRELANNGGYLVINEGQARGSILGANLCTFNLLQGTEYFPSLVGSVLFLEDDQESAPHHFDRDLQSIIHLPDFKAVKGIVIGRFQKKSGITDELLKKIIKTKKELDGIPVVANVDFGHTDPKITFPVGGEVEIDVKAGSTTIKIVRH